MKVLDVAQGSPEWLAARAGLVTASRFADVMATIKSGEAACRRNYRAQLVVERLTGKVADSFTTAAMRQGTEREPFARAAYEAASGNWVDEVGFCLHDIIPAGASPDGLIDADGGLECKCPELAAHLDYLRLDREPTAYTAQIQGCMWITGRQWWDFVSWNPDFPQRLQLVIRRVRRDDLYIAKLALAVAGFAREVDEETAAVLALPQAA